MPRTFISVVIPAYNEAQNIKPLLQRLDRVLTLHDIAYEAIIIDDHSTDNTWERVSRLKPTYPVKIFEKIGEPGKAYSLLEGFTKARHGIIVMIDADLQYAPENIPALIRLIEEGADVVVGERKKRETGILRNFISAAFHTLFSRWLHGISLDSQSGLKAFKKSVLKRLKLNPKPWTFDLEFLIQAKAAGYTLEGLDIEFNQRFKGESKIHLLRAMWEIGTEAVKLKMGNTPVIPVHPESGLAKGFHYQGNHYLHYSELPIEETALMSLTSTQRLTFLGLVFGSILLFLVNWHTAIVGFIAVMTFFYFSDVIFNLGMIIKALSHSQEFSIKLHSTPLAKRREWPLYSIFCPLYKEAHVLPQFIAAISALDYPKDKLQVLLLLEQNDHQTIKHAKEMDLPSYVEIVTIPHTQPKTKPKACNYGLYSAKGEYAVIYDAEDVPDPLQLKKAILAFEQSPSDVACVQAKLNFYNPHQNLLTRLFTAEYTLWFNLILPGLQAFKAPIPLGGTSNHFKTRLLRQLKGWDAFNVTEDCDLGLRLATKGYQTVIIDSVTLEEANSEVGNWINQRTRWLKGYLQTYLVHMRQFKRLINTGQISLLGGIQMVVGGKVIALLINPVMWFISILYFAFRPSLGTFIESFFPASVFYFAVAAFVAGNFLYVYYFMLATVKNHRFDLTKYALIMPFYWLLISLAAWKAVINLVLRPHYWFKTKHGLHLSPGQTSTNLISALKTSYGNMATSDL